MKRTLLGLLLILHPIIIVWAQDDTALDQYIAKPDPNYGFTPLSHR